MATSTGQGGGAGHPRPTATPATKPLIISKDEILAKLTDDEIKAAEACLKNNKKITITFGEIEVTHLPAVLDNGRLID